MAAVAGALRLEPGLELKQQDGRGVWQWGVAVAASEFPRTMTRTYKGDGETERSKILLLGTNRGGSEGYSTVLS